MFFRAKDYTDPKLLAVRRKRQIKRFKGKAHEAKGLNFSRRIYESALDSDIFADRLPGLPWQGNNTSTDTVN